MEEMVTISLDRYEDLLQDNYELINSTNSLKRKNKILSEIVLEEYLKTYLLETYSLEDVTDITSCSFALKNPVQLLRCFTLQELIDFITDKKLERDKEKEDE